MKSDIVGSTLMYEIRWNPKRKNSPVRLFQQKKNTTNCENNNFIIDKIKMTGVNL